MARKSPWHAAGSAVYHECTNCTEGNNIETGNKIFRHRRRPPL